MEKAQIWNYGALTTENKKREEGLPFNKRLAGCFDRIVVHHDNIQKNFSVSIITPEGSIEKDMTKVTEKEIYITQIKQKFYMLHTSEVQWLEYFTNDNIDFKEVWIALNSNIINEDTRTIIWEQIHLNYFNTYWFNKIGKKKMLAHSVKTSQNQKSI